MRILAVLLSLAAGIALTAQQQPVFRSTTQHVAVDVVVTDQQDRPVTNLTQEDFEIRENGVIQRIADFDVVSVPVGTRTVNVDAPPGPMLDVGSNAASPRSSRAIVIFVDNLSLSQSMRQLESPEVFVAVKEALTTFVRALSPDDQVAIVWQSRSDLSTDFTNDTERLVAAINSRRAIIGMTSAAGPAWRDRILSLKFAVGALAATGYARRAIVFVGTQACNAALPGLSFEAQECQDLYQKARNANVPIYALDPRVSPPAGDDTLAELAINTGGRHFMQQSRPLWAVEQIMIDNGSFYTLGFYPEPLITDGKYHKIDVTVKRPGLRVRSRDRYLADTATPPNSTPNREMTKALGAGLDDPGIPLRAFVAPLAATTRGTTRTLVTLEFAYPVPRAGDSMALNDELRLGILALTPDAKIKASFQRPITFTGRWKPTASGTFVINETIDLPQELLTVRVGITSQALRRTGTTHVRLDVPNYNKIDLQLSPIVLGDAGQANRGLDVAVGLDRIRGLVPFQPITVRTLAPTESLRVFTWAFWRSSETSLATEVRIDDRVLAQRSLPARSVTLGRRDATIDTVVPLAGLAPGRHAITVTASTSAKRSATRQVAIDIK
jgi:VWFA-related protein